MHSVSVRTMTMNFGKDAIDLAIGSPIVLGRCWDTVFNPGADTLSI